MTDSKNGAGDAPKDDDVHPDAEAPSVNVTETTAPPVGLSVQQQLDELQKPQHVRLIELCRNVPLFCCPEGEPYASVIARGHYETYALQGPEFKRWLTLEYYKANSSSPNKQAFEQAIGTLSARAQHGGVVKPVFVRMGSFGGNLYLDLVDDARRIVEISHEGWRVLDSAPIHFLRPKLLSPLPIPEHEGSLDDLRALLNVPSEHDFKLIVAWLLTALNPGLACPVLVVQGEAGSAKSTASRIIRQAIDPSTSPIRAMPRDAKDLFIQATSARVLAFDNLSKLTPNMSDTLCKMVTGAASSSRKLYTDRDEVSLNAKNPIILNGIDNFITRSDLRDRSIQIYLKRILTKDRRGDTELHSLFQQSHGRILGALLDGVAVGLRNFSSTHLNDLPRMADFIKWGTACEPAFGWPTGAVAAAFEANQREAVEFAIDADPLLSAFQSLMQNCTRWQGTPSRLLFELRRQVTTDDARNLPTAPSALGQELQRVATSLRKIGIEFERKREGKGRERMITITRRELDDGDHG